MKRFILCLLALSLLLSACGSSTKEKESSDGTYLYYTNEEESKVISSDLEFEAEDTDELCSEVLSKLLLQALPTSDEATEKRYLLPTDVEMQQHWIDEDQVLWISFNKNYENIDRQKEVLIRASIVRTMVQIDGIDKVGFMIEDQIMKDSYGNEIDPMDADSFVENSGEEINSYQQAEMTLYFTDEKGEKLKAESRSRYYNTSKPLERVVVEELIKGPKESGNYATIPSETKILGVTVSDKICYVNLSAEFSDAALNLPEDIPIYSIVNSLTALDSVDKVQISINENTNRVYREAIKLDQIFSADQSLVEENE